MVILISIAYGVYQFFIYPTELAEYNTTMNNQRPCLGFSSLCNDLIPKPINGNDHILPILLALSVHAKLSLLYWGTFLKPKTQSTLQNND